MVRVSAYTGPASSTRISTAARAKVTGMLRSSDEQHDPPDLRDRDGDDEDPRGRATDGVLAGRPHPLEDHREPHHDVAQDHHPVVEHLALLERGEHVGQAEREDQHPDHLHHRGQPVDPVVGVEGRGEPGEVDPGPRHREGREAEAHHPDPHVVLDQRVRELVGRGAEGDHEREVEEQLERGRGPVDLGHVAAGHPDDAVRLVGHGGILGIARVPSRGGQAAVSTAASWRRDRMPSLR